MNIAEPFIRRPVATTLLVLSIMIFGIMGYRLLPVSDLPNVDYPTIQVNASLPGASPDTMAAAIATPLEKQFATISGVAARPRSQPGRRDSRRLHGPLPAHHDDHDGGVDGHPAN